MATFVDDLERFRRLVRSMADELGKWRELVDPKRSPCRTSDLVERLRERTEPGYVAKWKPKERFVESAVARHNELWAEWQQSSHKLLPLVRLAQAPQTVEWVYCGRTWRDADDPCEPPHTWRFQSYADAIGHATEERHAVLSFLTGRVTIKKGSSFKTATGGGCALEFLALDAKALADSDGLWLKAPLWKCYDEMDLDWLHLLVEQEFLAARQKAGRAVPQTAPTNEASVSFAERHRIPIVDAQGNVIGVFDAGPNTEMVVGQLNMRDNTAEVLLVNEYNRYVIAVGDTCGDDDRFDRCRRVSAREAATWCYRRGQGHCIPQAVADDLRLQSGEWTEAECAEFLWAAGCTVERPTTKHVEAPAGEAAVAEPAPAKAPDIEAALAEAAAQNEAMPPDDRKKLNAMYGRALNANEPKDYNALAAEWIASHKDELAKDPWLLTVRKVAQDIGCSASTATTLPIIEAFINERGPRRRGSGRSPRVASYIEGTVGRMDEALERLKQEHEADFEPSSLDDDLPDKPQRVKILNRKL